MSIHTIESLISPVSSEEMQEVIRRKTMIASLLLKEDYPNYVTHTLHFHSESEPHNTNYELSYYINSENIVISYVSNDQLSMGISEDIWFKILHIPFFENQATTFSTESYKRIHATQENLIQNNIPLAALAINAVPHDELNYITFSHHQGFGADEALTLIKEHAINQLNTYGMFLSLLPPDGRQF
ncbi:MAG TPA: hypothetical protein PLS49_06790 [Candidatus Woesebacteria bacterium]|nr:hypothetical protein [Candidatus Woesebacteria bacterium]